MLNDIQKQEDPKAYEPEILQNIKAKQMRDQAAKQTKDNRYQEALEHEKALFDFDEGVNDLEMVEDRYPNTFKDKKKIPEQY